MIQGPGIFDKLSHEKLVGGPHPGKKKTTLGRSLLNQSYVEVSPPRESKRLALS